MIKRLLVQAAVLTTGALALVGLGGISNMLSGNGAADFPLSLAVADTTSALAVLQSKLDVTKRELERAHQVLEYSGRYGIPADLSARIYDHAMEEGIPPAIGFQLVKIESDFKNSAQSVAAATGLTQLQLATARSYDPDLDEADLMNADVSLRLGFRYLKDLLKRFDGDVALALEAYNKGPTLVESLHDQGTVVKGRYSNAIMSGPRKKT